MCWKAWINFANIKAACVSRPLFILFGCLAAALLGLAVTAVRGTAAVLLCLFAFRCLGFRLLLRFLGLGFLLAGFEDLLIDKLKGNS